MKKSPKKTPAKKVPVKKEKVLVVKKIAPKVKKKLTQEEVVKKFNSLIVDRNKDFKKLSRKARVVEICKDAVYNILNGTISPTEGEYCDLTGVKPGWLNAVDITMPEEGQDIREYNGVDDNNYNDNNGDSDVLTEKKKKTVTEAEDELFYNRVDIVKDLNMQPLLPVITCDACAKGGLMISAISFKNKLSIDEALDQAGDLGEEVPELLQDEFTEKEWGTLEAVFEQEDSFLKDNYDEIDYIIYSYPNLIGRLTKAQKQDGVLSNSHYGVYYEYKYFHKKSSADSRLLQMYLNIIAHKGDVMKAMSLLSTVKPNYKKLIDQIAKQYPIYDIKNAERIIKNMEKQLRPAPLFYKQILLDDSNDKI